MPDTVLDRPREKEENRTDLDVGQMTLNLWVSVFSFKMGDPLEMVAGFYETCVIVEIFTLSSLLLIDT